MRALFFIIRILNKTVQLHHRYSCHLNNRDMNHFLNYRHWTALDSRLDKFFTSTCLSATMHPYNESDAIYTILATSLCIRKSKSEAFIYRLNTFGFGSVA